MTGNGALKQPVISLRIEEPPLFKPRRLKAMVHVRGDHEIFLPLYEFQQILVRLARGLIVAVDIDVARPIRPEFFQGSERIKPARIHILKAVFSRKIGEILFKPFARIGESCGGRKPRSRADDDRLRLVQPAFQPLQSIRPHGRASRINRFHDALPKNSRPKARGNPRAFLQDKFTRR